MSQPNRLFLAAAVLSLAACGLPTSTTNARVGVQGATLALESGTQLTVPAGALKSEQELTMREVRHGSDVAIELQPEGLELEHAAEISWPDDGASAERGSGEHLEIEHTGGRGHHSMDKLETVWLRHHGEHLDGGEDHGRDGVDGGDDHGLDGADGGDDHGVDADGGTDGGDHHGGH